MSVIDKVYLKNISGDRIRYDLGANAENINYDETNLKDKIDDTNNSIVQHDELQVSTEEGAHGLRYYAQCLQGYNTEEEDWEIIQEGGSSVDYPIGDVIGASAEVNGNSVTLRQSDPNDIIVGELVLAEQAGTVLVRKVDSAPADVNDGTVLVTVTERNQYSSTGYIDNELSYDTNYYYKFFPYKLKEDETRRYTSGTSLLVRPATEIIENIPSPAANVEYSGASQSPTQLNYNPAQLDISGQSSGVNVGTYITIFTPKSGFTWSDGTTTAKNVSQTIVAKQVSIPSVTNTSFNYNGSQQGPTVSSYDTSIISISGDKRTDAGNYTLILSLNNTTNYVQTDGTTSNKETAQSISPIILALPAVTGTYIYNGSSKTVSISTSSTYVTISGTKTATNAGTYTIYVNLKSTVNTKQSDGTTTQKTLTQTIQKADAAVTCNPASGTIYFTNTYYTQQVQIEDSTGEILYFEKGSTGNDQSLIAPGTSSGFFYINVNKDQATQGTRFRRNVVISVKESDNYNSGTINYYFDYYLTPLYTQSAGTDNQIFTMINNYYNKNLELDDIKGVQAIGDTRLGNSTNPNFIINSYTDSYSETTTIPAQNPCKQVILDFNYDTLVSARNGITKALITIQTYGTIGNSNTNAEIGGRIVSGSSSSNTPQNTCERRTICNNRIYNALPSSFRSSVKQVVKKTRKSSSGTSPTVETNDYVFLLSKGEIVGNDSYESEQYNYFTTATNKKKYKGPTGNGSSTIQQLRTIMTSDSKHNQFYAVDHDTNMISITGITYYGISPAVCL